MIVKGLLDEDFVNYKKPSMVLFFPHCSFKCDKECGKNVCQNSPLAQADDIEIDIDALCIRYLLNPITKAIVLGGLEPMDDFSDALAFIKTLRYGYKCQDDIVIYTGYTEEECWKRGWIELLSKVPNIIIKFGRFIPGQEKHLDAVLGVQLASDNQYAQRIT